MKFHVYRYLYHCVSGNAILCFFLCIFVTLNVFIKHPTFSRIKAKDFSMNDLSITNCRSLEIYLYWIVYKLVDNYCPLKKKHQTFCTLATSKRINQILENTRCSCCKQVWSIKIWVCHKYKLGEDYLSYKMSHTPCTTMIQCTTIWFTYIFFRNK